MTNVLYDLLFVLPLSILATALGEPYFGGPENGLPLYLITLLITGTCLTVKHWENRLKYLLPGVLLAFASGVILIRDPLEREEFLWSHQWVLWTVLTALGSFFAGRLFAQIRLARRTLGVGLVALLVILQLMWAYPPKIAVACDFLLLSLIIADEFQHFWKKSGYTDAKGHLVSISPFLAVLAILVFLLPAPHDPYDWSFAVRLWQRATDAVKITSKWFHGSDEDYAGIIGFSDKQTFFGKLTKKDKDLLTVTGNRNVGDIVYLAGKVLNSFDGRAWTSTYEDEGRDKMLDTLETLSAVTAYDPDYLRNYVRRLELKIQFGEFNTKYYFLPLKSILAPDHVGDDMIRSVGGDVMTTGKFGYGSTYTITYYRMNQSHTGFQEFLENANSALAEASAAWKESNKVILTFGTAMVWKLVNSGEIVSNCLKRPSREFSHELLSIAQTAAVLRRIISAHPDKEFIFTVSPIRHMGEGAHLNTVSKATLQLAVEASGAAYFPAYEILLDELRDYRWFAEDLVHPTKEAADYIWERFNEAIR